MAKRQPSFPGARMAHVTSPCVARPSAPMEWPCRLFECMTPNIDSQIATKQKAAARQ